MELRAARIRKLIQRPTAALLRLREAIGRRVAVFCSRVQSCARRRARTPRRSRTRALRRGPTRLQLAPVVQRTFERMAWVKFFVWPAAAVTHLRQLGASRTGHRLDARFRVARPGAVVQAKTR